MSQKNEYEFMDVGELSTGIKVNTGKYEGMLWEYGKITPNEKDEMLQLNFTYTIHENPNEISEDQELFDYMGNILTEIMKLELEVKNDD